MNVALHRMVVEECLKYAFAQLTLAQVSLTVHQVVVPAQGVWKAAI